MAEINENRLTLNDMHVMYDSGLYEFMREKHGATIEWHDTYDSNGKRGFMEAHVKMIDNWDHPSAPLLYRHIIAEQLLADYKNVDWYEATHYTGKRLLRMAELWMHPLADCTSDSICKLAIIGCIAKEEYAPDRKKEIRKALEYIFRSRVLWFADHPLELGSDALFIGMTKGMWAWFFLTEGYDGLIDKILEGKHIEQADTDEYKSLDIFVLRDNLNYIAQERDGATAARLLRKFQEQWPKIKLWNGCGLEELDEEEVVQFENALFLGFDDVLAEWEAEGQTPIEENPESENPNAKFFNLSNFEYDVCEKELIRILTDSKWKSDVCRELSRSATAGYFNLKGMTNEEKANAINPWVAKVKKNWIFTGEDFRQAGRPRKRKE